MFSFYQQKASGIFTSHLYRRRFRARTIAPLPQICRHHNGQRGEEVTHARVIWPPYPYEAGFCITDDPDASTLAQTRAVYDYLMSKSFVTTKAIWVFEPELRCGIPPIPDSALRGMTLADPNFVSYCMELHRYGFELCLHGASAGNNTRERTQEAFRLFAEHYGSSDTFICHSKNADNIYWEEKITSLFPFRPLLGLYSKHTCQGEIAGSPYYWGDLCSSKINQIRLYRTRCCNTLKRNPSMPYYDPRKPLVNGWFSATKRPLMDCADGYEIERLKKENGLTVLYQYLHRYADPETNMLNERFIRSIDRISGDSKILVRTVSLIMKRLRQIQSVFVVFQENSFWLINVNDEAIDNLQIVSEHPLAADMQDNSIVSAGCSLVIKNLPGNSVKHVRVSDRIAFSHKNSLWMNQDRQIAFALPFGELLINLSENDSRTADNRIIPAGSFFLKTQRSGRGIPLLSTLPRWEELRLLSDQIGLIAREVILKGRSLNVEKYLDSSREIPMENYDNW
jgi:hypothetical protein